MTGIKKPACGRLYELSMLMIYKDILFFNVIVPPFIPPCVPRVWSSLVGSDADCELI